MELGERILNLRKESGQSQENLAEQLGVSRQTISRWENGKSIPDAACIKKMAEIYGIPADQILGLDVEQTDEKEKIFAVILSIIVMASCVSGLLGLMVSLAVVVKYQNKKYSMPVKTLSVVCLCFSVYNIYIKYLMYV